MRNTTTTVVIAAGAVLAAVIVTRTPAQQEYGGNPGACCLPDGSCQFISSTQCGNAGGTFSSSGIDCSMTGCPPADRGVNGRQQGGVG